MILSKACFYCLPRCFPIKPKFTYILTASKFQSSNFNIIETRTAFLGVKHYCNTNMTPDTKKFKSESSKIGTHSGRFHCDEILACFMLQQTKEYRNAEIIRSRDPAVYNTCDIVVDVGGVFDKEAKRFDHHQKSFTETFSSLRPELGGSYDIRLSSAGLIYTYFGEEVISSILAQHKNLIVPKESMDILYKKIYENFIREIDAIDNGVPICEGEPRYRITTSLSARAERFNSVWNDKETIDENILFEKSKALVGAEFIDRVLFYATSWLPARDIVIDAIKTAKDVYPTGEILELPTPCPWKEHLFDLEEQYGIVGVPKYVLMLGDHTDWRVICVPNQPSSFICRKFLHKNWRGKTKEEIIKHSGITDAQFCHSTGFVGGAASREGVYQMATQSLLGDYVD